MIRRRLVLCVALGLPGLGCAKDESKPADPSASPSAESPKTSKGEPKTSAAVMPDEARLSAAVGVDPGGIEREPSASAAVVAKVEGTVEVRRLGEEEWGPGAAQTKIYEGDLVRTSMQSSATIILADQSVIELAEESAIAVGDRATAKAPASSSAVLSGAARFTISPRAKGEGHFVAYAPAAWVAAPADAVFTVGVAADGRARVGVEKASLAVTGAAKLDAPVTIKAGMMSVIAVDGAIGAVAAYDPATWGAWRDDVDAQLDARAVVTAHGGAMGEIRGNLDARWKDLEIQAAQPVGEASFSAASSAQFLTWSLYAHAYLATEIYLRHPEVEVVYTPIQADVAAAILYPKKLHIVAHAWLRPAQVKVDLKAKAAVKPAVVAWYVRPATIKSKVMIGVAPTVRMKAIFSARPAVPMGQVKLHGGAAFTMGAKASVEAGAAADVATGAAVEAHGAAMKAKGVAVEAKGAAKGAVKVGAGAAAEVKKAATVEVNVPKPQPPKVEVKGKVDVKAKGGFKIGD